MNFIDRVQCSERLNFNPYTPWPDALPSVSWNGDLITGFESSAPVVEIYTPRQPFEKAFAQCHPKLSLVELSRFYRCIQDSPDLDINWPELFEHYQLRWCSNLKKIVEKVSSLPEPFLTWAHNKELHAKDLNILNSMSDLSPLTPTLLHLAELNASKSLGSKILEAAGELLLMNINFSDSFQQVSADLWLKQLLILRHPNTSQRDQKRTDFIKSLPWPKGVETRGLRQGDQYLLEIKLRVSNALELNKKSESLELIAQKIQNTESALWK